MRTSLARRELVRPALRLRQAVPDTRAQRCSERRISKGEVNASWLLINSLPLQLNLPPHLAPPAPPHPTSLTPSLTVAVFTGLGPKTARAGCSGWGDVSCPKTRSSRPPAPIQHSQKRQKRIFTPPWIQCVHTGLNRHAFRPRPRIGLHRRQELMHC
ncbi:MAG: hypothetical protein RIS92_2148 [Verrucomicrobiota bacterium]|jgi:hypothetical protein